MNVKILYSSIANSLAASINTPYSLQLKQLFISRKEQVFIYVPAGCKARTDGYQVLVEGLLIFFCIKMFSNK